MTRDLGEGDGRAASTPLMRDEPAHADYFDVVTKIHASGRLLFRAKTAQTPPRWLDQDGERVMTEVVAAARNHVCPNFANPSFVMASAKLRMPISSPRSLASTCPRLRPGLRTTSPIRERIASAAALSLLKTISGSIHDEARRGSVSR